MNQAFEDFIILELFTNSIRASYSGMYLADHGAKLIKIENPEGDKLRTEAGFQTLNRGKQSVVLDITKEENFATLEILIQKAHVVIVDEPQKKLQKKNLHYEKLREINQELIYLSMPPYGEKGSFVDRPYSPALLQAATGIMSQQISYSGNPTFIILPIAAYAAGVLGAGAIAGALFAQKRWNISQKLEVSEFAGAMALLMGADREFPNPHPMGSKGPIPTYRLFRTQDDKWFFLACANESFFTKLLTCIEREDLINDPRLKDAWVFSNQSKEIRDILLPIFEESFASDTRENWLNKLKKADCPAQPVLTRDEYFDTEVVRENNMRVTLEHPEIGTIDMMGVPLVLEECPGKITKIAPQIGENTKEILESMGKKEKIHLQTNKSNSQQGKSFFEGIKVLDLSAYIAGPVGARHLGMMGADVLKIEPPHGDAFRSHPGFGDFNQGKKAISLNLQMDEARKIFYDLVKTADIVIENFRPDVTKRLGVDYETLKKINPKIIYVSSPGFGDCEARARSPAFDPLLQSLSGAMLTQGGGEPTLHTIPLNDVFTPCIYTFGACTALLYRHKTGLGQRIRVSLAQSSVAIQAMEFTRFSGVTGNHFHSGSIDYCGPSSTWRWYKTQNGEIFIEAKSEDQQKKLIEATGVKTDSNLTISVDSLSKIFLKETQEYWISKLDNFGIPCNPVTPISGYWNFEPIRANGLVVESANDKFEQRIGTLIHASSTPCKTKKEFPKLSQHAFEIMESCGFSAKQQKHLIDIGAVVAPV